MASVYGTILTQVKSAIESLNLTDVTVKVRKKMIIHDDDVQPQVLVVPLTESEVDDGMEEGLMVDYPVLIVISMLTGNILDGSSELLMLTYRQAIRRLLRSVRVINVLEAPCTGVRAELNPAFDFAAGRDNQDVSGMVITYEVQEPRNV